MLCFLLSPWASNAGWESNDGEAIEVPGAPKIKDLDSFTEGTGRGSFDSIPAASTNEFGEPIQGPNALSLELLPVVGVSVEKWRKEVVIDIRTEPPYSIPITEDIAEVIDVDDIDRLSEMSLTSNLDCFGERPRMTYGAATSASDLITRHRDPHIKRARSSSPDFARRTRPRSQSLVSARSFSALHPTADLVRPPLILRAPRLLPRARAEAPD